MEERVVSAERTESPGTPGVATGAESPLLLLMRVQAVSSDAAKRISAAGPEGEAEAARIVAEMRSILGTVDARPSKYGNARLAALVDDLPPPLTSEEYILPRPLQRIHPEVLAVLASRTIEKGAIFKGLLLEGRHGSGKSEYPRLLAGIAPPHVRFVSASASVIRGSNNPALVLKTLIEDLEAWARAEDALVVLVLNEFDSLLTANSTMCRETSHTTSESSSSKRTRSTSSEVVTSLLQMDDVGQGLFNTLKDMLGNGSITRVYPITTSNLTDFPEPIYREGRLRRVEVSGLGREFDDPAFGRFFPYDTYRDAMPRALRLMDAAHFRHIGGHNSVLLELASELDTFFAGLPNYLDPIEEQIASQPAFGQLRLMSNPLDRDDRRSTLLTFDQNKECCEKVFEYFGIKKSGDVYYRISFSFAEHGGRHNSTPLAERYPEVKACVEMTPAFLMGYYLAHTDRFQNAESAKKALIGLFVPQLLKAAREEE